MVIRGVIYIMAGFHKPSSKPKIFWVTFKLCMRTEVAEETSDLVSWVEKLDLFLQSNSKKVSLSFYIFRRTDVSE